MVANVLGGPGTQSSESCWSAIHKDGTTLVIEEPSHVVQHVLKGVGQDDPAVFLDFQMDTLAVRLTSQFVHVASCDAIFSCLSSTAEQSGT